MKFNAICTCGAELEIEDLGEEEMGSLYSRFVAAHVKHGFVDKEPGGVASLKEAK